MANKMFKKNIEINKFNHGFFCEQQSIKFLVDNDITFQGFPAEYMRCN